MDGEVKGPRDIPVERWTARAVVAIALGLPFARLAAQQPAPPVLLRVDSDGERMLGAAVAGVGDLDGDGFDELALVAADGGAAAPSRIGWTRIVCGLTGRTRFVVSAAASAGDFAAAVVGIADLDGDGIRDLAVGAPGFDRGAGVVSFVRGADGGWLASASGAHDGGRFGAALVVTPDLDGDGVADLAVGAPGAGRVEFVSSVTRARIGAAVASAGTGFGAVIAPAPDLDGDGVPDLVVGCGDSATRCAWTVSVASRRVLVTLRAPALAGFGATVAWCGDHDGDRIPDVVVGAPLAAVGREPRCGVVLVCSSATGAELARLVGDAREARCGAALASLGDTDCDGWPELAIGMPGPLPGEGGAVPNPIAGDPIGDHGAVLIVDGATLRPAQRLRGSVLGVRHGAALGTADVNGDGFVDVVAAESEAWSSGGASGHVLVHSGQRVAPVATVGAGAGPAPVPSLWTTSAPRCGATCELRIDGPVGVPGVLLVGPVPARPAPLAGIDRALLHVGPGFAAVPIAPAATSRRAIAFVVPAAELLPERCYALQAVFPGSVTNGLIFALAD